MHKISIVYEQTRNNTFLALHYSFIAITKSLQSLRILKLFYNSCFGTLGIKIPGILRNYFLTSITGNQIPEVLDQRKSLVCYYHNVLVVDVISTKYKCVG